MKTKTFKKTFCNYTKETAKLCSKYHNCKYCDMKPQEAIEVHCHLDNPTPELKNVLTEMIKKAYETK